MMFVLIWILFGVGCAIAASNKNRSVLGWLFLGILLGPFGLLFILLLPSLVTSISPASFQIPSDPMSPTLPAGEISLEQETKKCPACAETIKLEAVKCRYCGEALDPQEVARQVEERRAALADDLAKITAGKKQCPRCQQWDVHRAYIEDGGQGDWCPNCEISLQKLAAQTKADKQSTSLCPFCGNYGLRKSLQPDGSLGDWCPSCRKLINFSQPFYG